MGLTEHKAAAPATSAVRVAVVTVSDTRTHETDEGGALVASLAHQAGFSVVARTLIPDEPAAIRACIQALTDRVPLAASTSGPPHVVLLTGGTGVAPRDGTVDVLAPLFQRPLDGFGELFRMLSFAEIGSAAMLSRACAGILPGGVAVFVMPGSLAAIRLAMQRLILPELGHLVGELGRPRSHGA